MQLLTVRQDQQFCLESQLSDITSSLNHSELRERKMLAML